MSGGRPIRLQLKVVPGSSKDEVAGWLGDALKVRVGAPAERGRANAAVEKLVAPGRPRRGGGRDFTEGRLLMTCPEGTLVDELTTTREQPCD